MNFADSNFVVACILYLMSLSFLLTLYYDLIVLMKVYRNMFSIIV